MGDKYQSSGGGFVQPPPYPGQVPQQQYPQQQYYPQQGYPQQQPYPLPPQQQQQQFYPQQQQQESPMFISKQEAGYKADNEAYPDGFNTGFDDKAVRRGFIRRVYSILMVQLSITAAIIAVFTMVGEVKGFVYTNRWFMWTCWGLGFALIIVLACCGSVRRKSPHNMILLGLFTVLWSCVLGSTAAYYEVEAVLIAVGITAAVTLGLTIFALQTKIDFTACGGVLFALLIILVIGGLLMWLVPASFIAKYNKYYMIGFGALGALVFSLYLIYDTQLMMGGKHKYSLSPEEYIFAALNLYLDVTQLFMYILMLVGGARSD